MAKNEAPTENTNFFINVTHFETLKDLKFIDNYGILIVQRISIFILDRYASVKSVPLVRFTYTSIRDVLQHVNLEATLLWCVASAAHLF
ncbi:MAG: hypothetical protein J6R66_02755 [Clostridia bacterium]|nr:hypothetical protein [Clostridia bacterium]